MNSVFEIISSWSMSQAAQRLVKLPGLVYSLKQVSSEVIYASQNSASSDSACTLKLLITTASAVKRVRIF